MAAVVPIKLEVTGAEQVKSTLKDIGKFVGAAFAVDKIKDFVALGLKEWSQAQAASNSLTAALGKQSDALINLANATAKQSKFKSEELTAGYSRLAMYGLTEKQIIKLAPAFDDLAAVTGDTETAAKMLGQAVVNGTGKLVQYGVDLDKTTTLEKRLTSVVDQSTEAFGGQAKAAFDAMNPMEKMTRVFEDSAAAVGEALVPTLNELYDAMPDITVVLSNITKGIISVFKFAQLGLTMIVAAVVGAMDGLVTLISKIPGHPKFIDGWKENLDIFTKTTVDQMGTISESIDKIWEKSEKVPETRKKKKQGPGEGEDKEAEKLEKEKAAAILRIQQESDQLYLNENEQKMYMLGVQYEEDMALFKDNEAEKAKIAALYEGKLTKVVKDEEKRIRDEREKNFNKFIDNESEKMAVDQENAMQREALARREAEQKKLDQELAMNATADQLGQIAQLLEGHKEFIGLYKTMAIAQATMDTYAAAISAYNSAVKTPIVGPVLGPIAAGVAIGFGLENVGKIASQKFAYGTKVTGGVPGQDSVPAMLMPGEIVYNPALPNPSLLEGVGDNYTNIGGTQIHVHGNVSKGTVAEIGRVTEKALISAMRKAQVLGKITSNGLKIRN
jgi:hypothetical protein